MVRSKAESVRQFPAELSGYGGRRSAPREPLRDVPYICSYEKDGVAEVSLNARSYREKRRPVKALNRLETA